MQKTNIMCEFDWTIITPILSFLGVTLMANIFNLLFLNRIKRKELEYKRAEFIYNQKHNGYENLLKTISKFSIKTRDLIFEDFLLVVFEFNLKENELDSDHDDELELFYEKYCEKFSSISKKYNDLYQLLNIEFSLQF